MARLIETERTKHSSWLGELEIYHISWRRGAEQLHKLARPLIGFDLWLFSMAMVAGLILTRPELTFANVRVLSGIVVICLGLTIVTQEYLSHRTTRCCQPSSSVTVDAKSPK